MQHPVILRMSAVGFGKCCYQTELRDKHKNLKHQYSEVGPRGREAYSMTPSLELDAAHMCYIGSYVSTTAPKAPIAAPLLPAWRPGRVRVRTRTHCSHCYHPPGTTPLRRSGPVRALDVYPWCGG